MGGDTDRWRTRAVEDFLRTVYMLQERSELVSTSLIGRTLHIQAASVSDMIRRLGTPGDETKLSQGHFPSGPLLTHQLHHGVRLTKAGEAIALQMLRRRRLLGLYLVQMLGYSWDEVDMETDRLEHDLTERLTERLNAAIGNPVTDLYGEPIPSAEGKLSRSTDVSLAEMPARHSGLVARIVDHSPELLRYLAALGLWPGTAVQVVDRSPLGDTITIQRAHSDSTCILSSEVAGHLRLTTDEPLAQGQQIASNTVYKSRLALKHIAQPR